MSRIFHRAGILILTTSLIVLSRPAQATLGGDVNSVENERAQLTAIRLKPEVHEGYSVHELNSAGMKLREYASADGVVFCITYKGVTQPDLQAMMGSYFDEFKSASEKATKQPGRRNYVSLEADHVKVERFGHARALKGRICATDRLPQGVNFDEIR
jgi:Protein of unknown function (DUF2844)